MITRPPQSNFEPGIKMLCGHKHVRSLTKPLCLVSMECNKEFQCLNLDLGDLERLKGMSELQNRKNKEEEMIYGV